MAGRVPVRLKRRTVSRVKRGRHVGIWSVIVCIIIIVDIIVVVVIIIAGVVVVVIIITTRHRGSHYCFGNLISHLKQHK